MTNSKKTKRKAAASVEGQCNSMRVTRAMTARSAPMAVFNTAELLENIVLRLEPRKIFAIQRVSTHFRDIVASSPAIRKRCWLRLHKEELSAVRWVSPLDVGWHIATDGEIDTTPAGEACERHLYIPVRLNPFLVPPRMCYYEELKVERGWGLTFPRTIQKPFSAKTEQSFMDTYICSPPCRSVDIRGRVVCAIHTKPRLSVHLYHGFRIDSCGLHSLTIGAILMAMKRSKGWHVIGPVKNAMTFEEQRSVSLNDLCEAVAPGVKWQILVSTIQVSLVGTVVPSVEEWETMKWCSSVEGN